MRHTGPTYLGGYDDRDEEPQDVTPLDVEQDDELSEYERDVVDEAEEVAAEEEKRALTLSRRSLFRGGVAAGAVAAAATSGLWLPSEPAEAHGTITSYPGIWGQRTRYEGSGNYASFGYRPSFHDRCSSWLEFWNTHAPGGRSIVVWTYGVHTDSRYSEAHNAGRGFDLTRIYPTINGSRHRRFFGRRDIWMNYGTEDRNRNRRWYWATSASVHHHFRNVLTYYYNADHNNHIHFDNLVSGAYNSNFSTSSKAQVQHVQACCRWIWGKNTTIDGVWGSQTRQHSHEVLVRVGKGGYLTDSKSHWLTFNRTTCRKGYGLSSY